MTVFQWFETILTEHAEESFETEPPTCSNLIDMVVARHRFGWHNIWTPGDTEPGSGLCLERSRLFRRPCPVFPPPTCAYTSTNYRASQGVMQLRVGLSLTRAFVGQTSWRDSCFLRLLRHGTEREGQGQNHTWQARRLWLRNVEGWILFNSLQDPLTVFL